MKNYRLAVDENGSPFVLNSRGSIDFGYITEEMNLSPAPIRIAEGNESYGLNHMIKNHSDQLAECGFMSVSDFVEFVSVNFTTIKEGHSGTFLLEVNTGRNNTLFIALSKGNEYWKVISGGVFRIQYSKKKKKVYSVPAIRMPEPVSQTKVPASDEIQQDSAEASGNSL
jgi:hypothetical protein